MNRPRFIRVIDVPEPRAATTIPGVRVEGERIAVGTVVPIEWFADTPDEVFLQEITPVSEGGWQIIEAYEPGTVEMARLRSEYPTLFSAETAPPAPQEAVAPEAKPRRGKTTEENA